MPYIREAQQPDRVPPAFPDGATVTSIQCVARSHIYLTANTHYRSGTLIPLCNDLSQFIEDTDESSIPVREFNLLACPLAQSS